METITYFEKLASFRLVKFEYKVINKKYEKSMLVFFLYYYAQAKHKKFFARKKNPSEKLQHWSSVKINAFKIFLRTMLGKLKPRKNLSKLGIHISYL